MDRLRAWTARFVYRPVQFVGGVVLISVMLLTVADVIGRYVFNSPVRGTLELTELGLVFIAFAGLAYAQHLDEHITVDLLFTRFPPLVQAVVNLLNGLLSLALVLLITWQLYRFFERMSRSGETTGVLLLPVYPVVLLAALAFGVFAIALLFDLPEKARQIRRAFSR